MQNGIEGFKDFDVRLADIPQSRYESVVGLQIGPGQPDFRMDIEVVHSHDGWQLPVDTLFKHPRSHHESSQR